VVASFPQHAQLEQLLDRSPWAPAADLLLLDPKESDGCVRNWAPPGFPAIRHVGYALQWFALALALFAIYVATNFQAAGKKS
jgi:cytochrome oxidase assembly protein ShyY1